MPGITFWEDVKATGGGVPKGHLLADLLAELEHMLTVPDAHLRDELAFEILGEWIIAGSAMTSCRRSVSG